MSHVGEERAVVPPGEREPWLMRMIDFAVLPGDRPLLVRAKRLFTAAMWASLFTSAVSVYQLYVAEAPWAAAALTVPILSAAVSLAAMWFGED